jgi:hypothetical protein
MPWAGYLLLVGVPLLFNLIRGPAGPSGRVWSKSSTRCAGRSPGSADPQCC